MSSNQIQKSTQNRNENLTVSKSLQFLMKKTNTPLGDTTKKINFDSGANKHKDDDSVQTRPTFGSTEKDIQETIDYSYRPRDVSTMRAFLGAFLKKEKQVSSNTQAVSPRSAKPNLSPYGTPPIQIPGNFNGPRATLKGLAQKTTIERVYLNSKSPNKGSKRVMSPNQSLNLDQRQHKSSYQGFTSRSMQFIEKENQILKEENELLKKQLNDIKKEMIFGTPTKKEELISSLRDTLKREDAAVKQLKLKLDLSNKKVSSLNSMLETKDEEIAMLTNKVNSLEVDVLECRKKNLERYELLKEKVNFVLRAYGQLDKKFNSSQLEWLKFKEQWLDEKGMYLHRIQFLEEYIASN